MSLAVNFLQRAEAQQRKTFCFNLISLLSFFLFTSELIRFWILRSNWVRLIYSCHVSSHEMVFLHGKVIVIIASQMVLPTLVVTKIYDFL